jgi:hypothetical protein
VSITSIEFGTNNMEDNVLAIRLEYRIPDIAVSDLLEFTI